jgi:hypothetical protein
LNNDTVTIPTVVINGDFVECGKAAMIINLGVDTTSPPTQRITNLGESE